MSAPHGRRRWHAAIILVLALPGAVHAQDRAAASPDNPVRSSFQFIAARFGGYLQAAFDSIPADRYAYRPMPAQQSIGYIAQHLTEANYALCERLGPLQRAASARTDASDSVQARWPKDTLVARLRASFRFCDAAVAQVRDDALGRSVPYGPAGSGARAQPARSLLLFVTDLAEHYSQLSGYMRQLGLVPPSALPPRARTAIALPADVLSRYVGVYSLPPNPANDLPGFMLEVSRTGDALFVTPATRAPRRLWAESRTEFFVKEVDAQVTFLSDASGRVTAMVVHQDGQDRRAERVK